MRKFDFILTCKNPKKFILRKDKTWTCKIIVEANTVSEAYFEALHHFAVHMHNWYLEPNKIEISYREL